MTIFRFFMQHLPTQSNPFSFLTRISPTTARSSIHTQDVLKVLISINRSSHRRSSVRKGVLRNFVKFTGKHLYQSFFFNKVAAGLRPATLLKKRLWHRCFPLNFAKFLKTPFLQNSPGQIARPMPVGRARAHKTSETHQIFRARKFYRLKKIH